VSSIGLSLSRTRTLGLRAAAIAIGNEIEKGLLAAWGERLQIVIELPLFPGFFLLLALVLGAASRLRAATSTGASILPGSAR